MSPPAAGPASAAHPDPSIAEAFVVAHTVIQAHPYLPELRLHLSDTLTPLWIAAEAAFPRFGAEPPYWAFAWPGSLLLARRFFEEPAWVAGRRVLDFAAGSGLSGIAAARLGAQVTAVEIDPLAGAAIRLNARLNDLSLDVKVEDIVDGDLPEVDLIVAGDICYSRPMVARVLPFLRRCARSGIPVLLGDPSRAYPPDDVVVMGTWEVPTLLELEDTPSRMTRLLRLNPG